MAAPKGRPWYWTEADEAELDVLTWALVGGLAEHYPRCARCLESVRCEATEEALEAVVDWLTARRLLSRAEALRLENEGRRLELEGRVA